jgi:hypothetical protein
MEEQQFPSREEGKGHSRQRALLSQWPCGGAPGLGNGVTVLIQEC